MKIIERLLEALRPCQSFCIAGHVRPDGDCVGSQLGLTLALRHEGKQVLCWNEDDVPQKYAFLDPDGILQKPPAVPTSQDDRGHKFDCVIALDAASLDRLGRVAEVLKLGVPSEEVRRTEGTGVPSKKSPLHSSLSTPHSPLLINIDHHTSNTRFGDLNWVMPRAPSTGELIYQLLRQARWPITPPIADCLFTAISTDTGSFQYPTTRPTSYHVAGQLVKRGADLEKICQHVYQSYPISRVRLLQGLYNRFRLTAQDRIAYFWLKPADFARSGAHRADAEGLIDHLRAIEPVVVAAIFEEVEPELIRVSLRSKTTAVDVNEVAKPFGGGGHPAAAGMRIRGRPLAVQRRVIAAIKAALPRPR